MSGVVLVLWVTGLALAVTLRIVLNRRSRRAGRRGGGASTTGP